MTPNNSGIISNKSSEEYCRRHLEAVTNNASVALFIIDGEQQCVFMNPAAEKLTGFTFEELEEKLLHDYIHRKHADGRQYPIEECPINRVFPQNNREQGEETFVHKDGSFYPVAFTASPIKEDEKSVGTIIEVRNISREKEDENELKSAAEEIKKLLLAERAYREESETLLQIGQIISAELDLQKIVQAVTDAATEITGAQFGAFFYNVLDEKGASYMLYALSGVPLEAFSDFPMPRATHLFGPTFRGEGAIRIGNVCTAAAFRLPVRAKDRARLLSSQCRLPLFTANHSEKKPKGAFIRKRANTRWVLTARRNLKDCVFYALTTKKIRANC